MMAFKYHALAFALIVSLLFVSQGLQLVQTVNQPAPNSNKSADLSLHAGSDQQVTQSMQSNSPSNTAYWMNLATNAWQYFQPGNGVNSQTGLHDATIGYDYFTDWDLGTYIQAILDAQQLGILSSDGTWGANARIDKILTFLETRPLMSNGQPYAWYDSNTGKAESNSVAQVAWDAGNLLVALKNVELSIPNVQVSGKPDFKSRIDNIVYNLTNYEPEAEVVAGLSNSSDVYDYYAASGFAAFWPDGYQWSSTLVSNFPSEANTILSNIVNSPSVPLNQTYGVTLPQAGIILEPMLLSIFDLPQPAPSMLNLTGQVSMACAARYSATRKYTAFTEGNTGGVEVGSTGSEYVYEYIVESNGQTWVVQGVDGVPSTMTPIIYLKAAVSLDALYSTTYTQNMVNAIMPSLYTSNGYMEGVDENGRTITNVSDKTNGMIISAARYAINNNINSTLPTPTPTQSPTSTASSMPSSNASPTSHLSTPTPSASIPPSPIPSPSNTPVATFNPSSTPIASPSPTDNSSPPDNGLPWQTNPLVIGVIVVAIAVAVVLPVIILRRSSSSKPH